MTMVEIGSPLRRNACKILLLGAGELGKEFTVEALRLGAEVVAVDRDADAPAMQLAQRAHVLDLRDAEALYSLAIDEAPDFIVPNGEALAATTLRDLEAEALRPIPNARAICMSMDHEALRRLVADELGLRTPAFVFADDEQQFLDGVDRIGRPCAVKPARCSNAKAPSTISPGDRPLDAWNDAIAHSREASPRVIIEEVLPFGASITLLTIRHADGTSFCEPIGHGREPGEHQESWQPARLGPAILDTCHTLASAVTTAIGGVGVFSVEFLIDEQTVYLSHVSPGPRHTGMVTMVTQQLSQFALHIRAILGLPIPARLRLDSAGACAFIKADAHGHSPSFRVDARPLRREGAELQLFGKSTTHPGRRMGLALARGSNTAEARRRARQIASSVRIHAQSH